MRLIDADKLETDTIYATHLNHVECGYHYSYSEGRINEAPTVEAIPVEWLRQKYGWLTMVHEIIADWRNEQARLFEKQITEECTSAERFAEWEKENEDPSIKL